MAGISSLGVGSGLDLGGLVQSLLAAERAPLENSLNRRESQIAADLSGLYEPFSFGRKPFNLFQFLFCQCQYFFERNVTNASEHDVFRIHIVMKELTKMTSLKTTYT